MDSVARRGFMKEEFRIFRLRDNHAPSIDYHYHEFDKIVVFLSGDTSYIVEGRTYHLQPWDVLFIPHHDIHRPVIDSAAPYERVVIWVDPAFLQRISTQKSDLSRCFEMASKSARNLCRPWPEMRSRLSRMIEDVQAAYTSTEFGAEVLFEASFIRLMVAFNRLMLALPDGQQEAFEYDPKISEVLRYINDNLSSDLSIEALCGMHYMSRYHFMRKFKEVTGYTAHNYVRQKRLAYASQLIIDGASPSEAAELSGFTDYSSFLRAFKQQFNTTPKLFAQNHYRREEIID